MKFTLSIENTYADETVKSTVVVDLPDPPKPYRGEAFDEWAYEHVHALTGTESTRGHSPVGVDDDAYFVTVLACDDPALVGTEFAWGI